MFLGWRLEVVEIILVQSSWKSDYKIERGSLYRDLHSHCVSVLEN